MHEIYAWISDALGLELSGASLSLGQMALRSAIVLPCTIVMVRVAGKRFLGRNAAFDVVLAIVLGSVVSRGINGQAAFFPTLGAGFTLVLLHRLLALAACRSHRFSLLIKGRDRVFVRDGQVDHAALKRADFTPDDLLENLRLQGNVGTVEDVAEARLERSGHISVVHKSR